MGTLTCFVGIFDLPALALNAFETADLSQAYNLPQVVQHQQNQLLIGNVPLCVSVD